MDPRRLAAHVGVHDLEQSIQDEVASELLADVLAGDLALADIVGDAFVIDLHRRLYSDVWSWGGVLRRHEVNIGVAPEQIAVQLRSSLDSCRYRWENTADWSSRELVATQDGDDVQLFDWDVDKPACIGLLREFDQTHVRWRRSSARSRSTSEGRPVLDGQVLIGCPTRRGRVAFAALTLPHPGFEPT